jgi:putative membrane protein insertion efficiency factor
MNMVQKGLIFIIRIYQLTLSPLLLAAFGPSGRCRFTPSCSQYASEAVRLHGAVRGGFLAGRRLCRCHPWGDFGEDFPPQPNFRRDGREKTEAITGRARLPRAVTGSIRGSTESRPTLSKWKRGHCHGS